DSLVLDEREFAIAWGFHPGDYHRIKMHGRLVATPRWQQAYGRDYEYTGRVNTALPLETLTAAVGRIQTIVSWSREEIDGRLNGLLLNWYDGNLGHYIGRHRDSTRNMIEGAPIVTLSFGESRRFRLRPYRAPTEPVDFEAGNGTVFVMPYETNLAWTAYSGQSERAIRFKMNAPSGAS
ncbi:MAG TPA: alpha-ketoglutarate-dependent dioxygenase AlkB, partial [Candidatus Krumholzibacteria bacterium]